VAARVKALLRRQAIDTAPQPSAARRAGDITIHPDEHEAHLGGAPLPLTPTEFRLLQVLMGQPGRAYSRAELIEHGLGPRFNGKERTLDSHMRNLRAKIEHGPHHKHYVKTVFGVGYRLVVPLDGAGGAGRPAVDSVAKPLVDRTRDDTAGH